MWSDLESYEQIEPEYKRAVAEFEDLKSRYETVLTAHPDDPQVAELYVELQKRAEALQSLFEKVQSLRRSLAETPTIGY